MNEKMSTVALGMLLKKVYPCVESKSERLKADWSKKNEFITVSAGGSNLTRQSTLQHVLVMIFIPSCKYVL